MTVSEIIEAARREYNAVGDTNWSDSELCVLIYQACMMLATEAKVIRRIHTTTTTAAQREYAIPTNTISIKRVEYNGQKLHPLNFREDDVLTLGNASTTNSGTPQHYAQWDETIFLRPIPAEAQTLKIFSFMEPQAVTTSSTLEVPTRCHPHLKDFLLERMYSKDKDFSSAKYFGDKWEKYVTKEKQFTKRMLRGDAFPTVQDEELLTQSLLGAI